MWVAPGGLNQTQCGVCQHNKWAVPTSDKLTTSEATKVNSFSRWEGVQMKKETDCVACGLVEKYGEREPCACCPSVPGHVTT